MRNFCTTYEMRVGGYEHTHASTYAMHLGNSNTHVRTPFSFTVPGWIARRRTCALVSTIIMAGEPLAKRARVGFRLSKKSPRGILRSYYHTPSTVLDLTSLFSSVFDLLVELLEEEVHEHQY